MTTAIEQNLVWTVTCKESLRILKYVTNKYFRDPVVITSHRRPRHVLLAYEGYERLRYQER